MLKDPEYMNYLEDLLEFVMIKTFEPQTDEDALVNSPSEE